MRQQWRKGEGETQISVMEVVQITRSRSLRTTQKNTSNIRLCTLKTQTTSPLFYLGKLYTPHKGEHADRLHLTAGRANIERAFWVKAHGRLDKKWCG